MGWAPPNHHFSICPELWKQDTVQKRKELAKKQNCCFHCSGKGHVAKNCAAREIKHSCHNDGDNHWFVFCPNSPGLLRVESLNPEAEAFQPEGAQAIKEAVENAVASADAAEKVTKEVTAAADAQAAKEGGNKFTAGMVDYATHASFAL